MKTGNGKEMHRPGEAEVVGEPFRRVVGDAETDSLDRTKHLRRPFQIGRENPLHAMSGTLGPGNESIPMPVRLDNAGLRGINSEPIINSVALQPAPVVHGTGIPWPLRAGDRSTKKHPVAIGHGLPIPAHLNHDWNRDRIALIQRRDPLHPHRKSHASGRCDPGFLRDDPADFVLPRVLLKPFSKGTRGRLIPIPEMKNCESHDRHGNGDSTAPRHDTKRQSDQNQCHRKQPGLAELIRKEDAHDGTEEKPPEGKALSQQGDFFHWPQNLKSSVSTRLSSRK